MALTGGQVQRYRRHLLWPRVGAEGWAQLLESPALFVVSLRGRPGFSRECFGRREDFRHFFRG